MMGSRWVRMAVVACVAGAGLLSADGARADNYGAIAFSQQTGTIGWSYDYRTRADAERTALQKCANSARDCTVPIWFRNACGAIAIGDNNGFGTGWGTDRGIAESYALQTCRKHARNCSVRRWVCTTR